MEGGPSAQPKKSLFEKAKTVLAAAAAFTTVSAITPETANAQADDLGPRLQQMKKDMDEASTMLRGAGVPMATAPAPRTITAAERVAAGHADIEFEQNVAEMRRLGSEASAKMQQILGALERQNASTAEKLEALQKLRQDMLNGRK